MTESRKTLIIVLVVAAVLIAIYSGWKVFGSSTPSPSERTTTTSGPINRMSSILGPDANGKPRTEMPAAGQPSAQPGGGMTPAERMRGPAGQQPPQ